MKPPLPVYHPLGRLALALPEIDLETLGLRAPLPISIDDATRRSSSRPRRPAAKLRDADVEAPGGSPLAAPAEAPAEKPSPRKRRGGPAGGARRRRREPEDVDGTYPAKRTRNARAADVDSPAGSVAAGADVEDVADAEEKAVPERRSTRSRAAAVKPAITRRGSSASDGTQTSISVSIAASRRKEEKGGEVGKAKEAEGAEGLQPLGQGGAEKRSNGEPADVHMEDVASAPQTVLEVLKEPPAGVVPPEGPSPPSQPPREPSPAPEVRQKEEGELSEDGELPSKQ